MITMPVCRVKGEDFHFAITIAKLNNPRIAENCTDYSVTEYDAFTCYLSQSYHTGFVIKPDGELANVFSTEHLGKSAVTTACALGAKKLDCFDGYLPEFYASLGFVEVGREPNWVAGGPDVVYMAIDNKSKVRYNAKGQVKAAA